VAMVPVFLADQWFLEPMESKSKPAIFIG